VIPQFPHLAAPWATHHEHYCAIEASLFFWKVTRLLVAVAQPSQTPAIVRGVQQCLFLAPTPLWLGPIYSTLMLLGGLFEKEIQARRYFGLGNDPDCLDRHWTSCCRISFRIEGFQVIRLKALSQPFGDR
jgi:hypothetical protein